MVDKNIDNERLSMVAFLLIMLLSKVMHTLQKEYVVVFEVSIKLLLQFRSLLEEHRMRNGEKKQRTRMMQREIF